MPNPHEPGDTESNARQIDHTQPAAHAPSGTFCRECRASIRDEYYDVGGNVVCTACHAKRGRVRHRLFRGFKALLFGSVAAAVGAGVYRMIMLGTGWNFSLVAILVGYMVGGAVKTGSHERGGRFYQFLAIFLTYSALVGMFLPEFWNAVRSSSKEAKQTSKQIGNPAHDEANTEPARNADAKVAENPARPKAEASPDAAASKPVRDADARTKPATLDVKSPPEDVKDRSQPRRAARLLYLLCMLLVTLVLLVGLAYSIPVLVGIHSPISLLIFGIALWQAWRMNRAIEVLVTGPYRVPR